MHVALERIRPRAVRAGAVELIRCRAARSNVARILMGRARRPAGVCHIPPPPHTPPTCSPTVPHLTAAAAEPPAHPHPRRQTLAPAARERGRPLAQPSRSAPPPPRPHWQTPADMSLFGLGKLRSKSSKSPPASHAGANASGPPSAGAAGVGGIMAGGGGGR